MEQTVVQEYFEKKNPGTNGAPSPNGLRLPSPERMSELIIIFGAGSNYPHRVSPILDTLLYLYLMIKVPRNPFQHTVLPSACSSVSSSTCSPSHLTDSCPPVHALPPVGASISSNHNSPLTWGRLSRQIWKPCISREVLKCPENMRSTVIFLLSVEQ